MRLQRKARSGEVGSRMVADIRTGRFERSLAGLAAAGAVVTAAEIFTEHDGASFGNKMMWWPIVIIPTMAPAGVAAVFSRRAAKTILPLASAVVVANGLQGTLPALAGDRPEAGWPLEPSLQHRDGAAHVCAATGLHGWWHGHPGRPTTPRGGPVNGQHPSRGLAQRTCTGDAGEHGPERRLRRSG